MQVRIQPDQRQAAANKRWRCLELAGLRQPRSFLLVYLRRGSEMSRSRWGIDIGNAWCARVRHSGLTVGGQENGAGGQAVAVASIEGR